MIRDSRGLTPQQSLYVSNYLIYKDHIVAAAQSGCPRKTRAYKAVKRAIAMELDAAAERSRKSLDDAIDELQSLAFASTEELAKLAEKVPAPYLTAKTKSLELFVRTKGGFKDKLEVTTLSDEQLLAIAQAEGITLRDSS